MPARQALSDSSQERPARRAGRKESQVVMAGWTGRRLFILEPVRLANNTLVASVSAPIGSIMRDIEREFWRRIIVLLLQIPAAVAGTGLPPFHSKGPSKAWLDGIKCRPRRDSHLETRLGRGKRGRRIRPAESAASTPWSARWSPRSVRSSTASALPGALPDSHCVMLLIDQVDGAILDANQAAAKYYGWSREVLTGMNIFQINTLTPEQIRAEMQRASLQHEDHFRFRHRRADGSVRDVESFSGPIRIGEREVLYSIITDVTEAGAGRNEILQAVDGHRAKPGKHRDHQSRRRNRIYKQCLPQCHRLQQGPIIIGQNPRILHSGQNPPERHVELWQALVAGHSCEGSCSTSARMAPSMSSSPSSPPVTDASGRISHYVAVKEDITERKRIAQLDEHRQHLEELVAIRTTELSLAKQQAKAPARQKRLPGQHEPRDPDPMNAISG